MLSTVYCRTNTPTFDTTATNFRRQNNLSYPINFLRNVARKQARTHFVMASDIELYPSPNIIPKFVRMVATINTTSRRVVFVVPSFHITNTLILPNTKGELVKLIGDKKAFPMHEQACNTCHLVPNYATWIAAPSLNGRLEPVNWISRENIFDWEPEFIGTNADPWYHEHLVWEGRRGRAPQVKCHSVPFRLLCGW